MAEHSNSTRARPLLSVDDMNIGLWLSDGKSQDHPVVSWKLRHPPPRRMPRNGCSWFTGIRYFLRGTVAIALTMV